MAIYNRWRCPIQALRPEMRIMYVHVIANRWRDDYGCGGIPYQKMAAVLLAVMSMRLSCWLLM